MFCLPFPHVNPDVFKMPPLVLKRKASADLGEVQHLKKKKKKNPMWNGISKGREVQVKLKTAHLGLTLHSTHQKLVG